MIDTVLLAIIAACCSFGAIVLLRALGVIASASGAGSKARSTRGGCWLAGGLHLWGA